MPARREHPGRRFGSTPERPGPLSGPPTAGKTLAMTNLPLATPRLQGSTNFGPAWSPRPIDQPDQWNPNHHRHVRRPDLKGQIHNTCRDLRALTYFGAFAETLLERGDRVLDVLS